MKTIILNKENVIVGSGENVYEVENGLYVDGVIYAEPGITFADTNEPFEIQKFMFVDGKVLPNPNYITTPPSMEELLSQLKTANQVFNETDPQEVDLNEYKKRKINALKEDCTAAIYAGFESATVGESFGFNANDQMNFTQLSLRIVSAGGSYNKPIYWKTLSGSIVTLSTEQFNVLLDEAEAHKIAQQSKFWQLEEAVKAAADTEEVKAVIW